MTGLLPLSWIPLKSAKICVDLPKMLLWFTPIHMGKGCTFLYNVLEHWMKMKENLYSKCQLSGILKET